jgi:serine/threonine protein kinase
MDNNNVQPGYRGEAFSYVPTMFLGGDIRAVSFDVSASTSQNVMLYNCRGFSKIVPIPVGTTYHDIREQLRNTQNPADILPETQFFSGSGAPVANYGAVVPPACKAIFVDGRPRGDHFLEKRISLDIGQGDLRLQDGAEVPGRMDKDLYRVGLVLESAQPQAVVGKEVYRNGEQKGFVQNYFVHQGLGVDVFVVAFQSADGKARVTNFRRGESVFVGGCAYKVNEVIQQFFPALHTREGLNNRYAWLEMDKLPTEVQPKGGTKTELIRFLKVFRTDNNRNTDSRFFEYNYDASNPQFYVMKKVSKGEMQLFNTDAQAHSEDRSLELTMMYYLCCVKAEFPEERLFSAIEVCEEMAMDRSWDGFIYSFTREAQNGCLYDFAAKRASRRLGFSEVQMKAIATALLSANHALHEMGLYYYDGSAENTLWYKGTPFFKIWDYGMATHTILSSDGTRLPASPKFRPSTTHLGRPTVYGKYWDRCPECRFEHDGVLGDTWSIGTVLYLMRFAKRLLNANDFRFHDYKIFGQISEGSWLHDITQPGFGFNETLWVDHNTSNQTATESRSRRLSLMDLICRLCVNPPTSRIPLPMALEHPYFHPYLDNLNDDDTETAVLARLDAYQSLMSMYNAWRHRHQFPNERHFEQLKQDYIALGGVTGAMEREIARVNNV